MKKLFSILLVLVISMSFAATAFAAENKCYNKNLLSDGTCNKPCCNEAALEYSFVEQYKCETASAWAHDALKDCIRKGYMGLWDVNMDSVFNYHNNITRQEFMVMVIGWISAQTDTNIGLLIESAIPPDVLAGDFLPIIINANRYSPYMEVSKWIGISDGSRYQDTLTREEATTMIMRAVNAVEITKNATGPLYEIKDLKTKVQATISAPDAGYADASQISTWAKDAVNFCKANGIMSGKGNNIFDPKGLYTVEQAIVTLSRIG